jgi:preprotein translocase subunit Sec63
MGKLLSILLLAVLSLLIMEALGKIPDPYEVLGIARNADTDAIKAAFKKKSK